LLFFMAVTAIGILRVKNLFAAVMLGGIYSLLSALMFVNLDAVDVAFTEASVGAGISTVLMLGTLALTSREEKTEKKTTHNIWLPLVVCLATGAALIYGTLDMPDYGDPNAPVHKHVAPRYLVDSETEVGMPNIVTSVLASYRGFDTLGETTVVFTALIGVLILLAGRRRKSKDAPTLEELEEREDQV
jgi:multicomponent Na+:H+ antiporter subunit B